MGCHFCDKKNELNIDQINENRLNNNNESLNNILFNINSQNNDNKIFKKSSNNLKIKDNYEKSNSFNSTNNTLFNTQKNSLENLKILMLNEINFSRKNPKKIIQRIDKYKTNIHKNSKNEYYIKVDIYNKIKLFKGIEIFENCKNYLNNIKEILSPFELKNELTFPFPTLRDSNNIIINTISFEEAMNEKYLTDTLKKLKNELVLKNIDLINFHYDIMNSNIELSVLLQIIDDTNSQFQRRKNIFMKEGKYIGINIGKINESLYCYFLVFGKDI